MKAIILAAGRGSRMNDLTREKPKGTLIYQGKPLIEWQVDALTQAGIQDIGIVTGYRQGSFNQYPLHNFFNPLWNETNMVSSLEYADEWLSKEECIVSYSDIYYQSSAILKLIKSDTDIAITFDPNWLKLWKKRFKEPLSDAETFALTDSGNLLEIGNKPHHLNQIQGQYMGLLKITPKGWSEISRIRNQLPRETNRKMHMTHLLQRTIKAGNTPIKAIEYLDGWMEIDAPSDLNIIY